MRNGMKKGVAALAAVYPDDLLDARAFPRSPSPLDADAFASSNARSIVLALATTCPSTRRTICA